ncbi:RHS repeat-associated core domain-containing protein [Noviherbaspirillum sp.]|uniref:RHS repeat-associated core domain-containing protein n=1 Tax=Noviherbaspirillum sp. TaxID=1926288 RepID=UPI002FE25AE9
METGSTQLAALGASDASPPTILPEPPAPFSVLGAILNNLIAPAEAAPPPIGASGDKDLLERVRQADAAATNAAAGNNLPENVEAIKTPVAEALPCSEPGRAFQTASLQYLNALAADAACKAAFQAISQPTLDDVNNLLNCQPTQALLAAYFAKGRLSAQVAASTCVVTAETKPVEAPPPPPAAPPPNIAQAALSKLLQAIQNIAYGTLPQTSSSLFANGNTDPVDLFSGTFVQKTIDLTTPGLIPVQLGRYYHSILADKDGPFGKGTGIVPYGARLTVQTNSDGTVVKAAGTQLSFSSGDLTEVPFTDLAGTLEFTAFDKTGFAGDRIVVRANAQGAMEGAEMRQPGGNRFLFDAQGKLMRIEDRNGNAVQIILDTATQKIARIFDPSTGKGIDLIYNAQGFISKAIGLQDQSVSYEYDEIGRLIGVTDSLKQTTRMVYDARGQLVTMTDARGTVALTNVYDPDTRVVTGQILGDGSVIQIEYPDELTRRVTDGNGNTTVYRYDPSGLFAGITTGLGQTYMVSYSPAMFDNSGGPRIITRTDPAGRTSVAHLNHFNQLVRAVDAAGRTAEFAYEPRFQLMSSTKDPLGRVTSFTHDNKGNLIAVTDPVGNRAVFTYTDRGQVATATNPMQQTAVLNYDAAHNLVRVTDPLGNATSLGYDALSRMVAFADAKGNSASFTYDALNRLTRAVNPLGIARVFSYDPNGNLIAQTDARGNTATASYDVLNRPTLLTVPGGRTTNVIYDAVGNVRSTTDAKGQTTTYAYNALNQRTQASYADGSSFQYTYDELSRLSAIQNATGQRWGFTYDILNRVVGTSSPQGSLTYAYDTGSQLTELSSPDTGYAPVAYSYDKLGRVTTVTQNGRPYRFSYDCLGRRTALARPNDYKTTYAYDAGSRLTALTHQQGTTPVQSHRYTLDATGNISRYVRTDKATEIARSYQYDPSDRLVQVEATGTIPSASGEVPERATWEFDDNGNITKKTSQTAAGIDSRTLTYDAADRLVKVTTPAGAIDLSYDANGNLIGDSTGRKLTWNALDQLTRLEAPGVTASFGYDPLGRRTSFEGSAAPRTYLYSGMSMLRNGESSFLHGTGIDEVLELTTSSDALSYLHDHAGSTSALVNATTGQTTADYHYKSYGAMEARQSNPVPRNPFTYTGREDDGTGLYYYRARYYDPALEVFISQDPMGDGQRYVGGNPLRYGDPLGLEAGNSGASQSESIHVTLDIIGAIGFEPADAANAAFYAAEGDYGNAALSSASMVPGVGQATFAAKYIGKLNKITDAAKSAEAAADAALAAGKLSGAAAELRVGDKVFVGVSGEIVPHNPQVTGALMGTPQAERAAWHGACAEVVCLDKALNAGVNPAGGTIRVVNIGVSGTGHNTPKVICSSCNNILNYLGVSK